MQAQAQVPVRALALVAGVEAVAQPEGAAAVGVEEEVVGAEVVAEALLRNPYHNHHLHQRQSERNHRLSQS